MKETFSRTTQGTRRRSSSRKTSPTRPERAPPIPAVRPAWLRSWQGKPPTTNSTSEGRALSSVTSRGQSTCAILARRTARAGSQISHRRLVSWPAAASPRSNPPMPANRPATLTYCLPHCAALYSLQTSSAYRVPTMFHAAGRVHSLTTRPQPTILSCILLVARPSPHLGLTPCPQRETRNADGKTPDAGLRADFNGAGHEGIAHEGKGVAAGWSPNIHCNSPSMVRSTVTKDRRRPTCPRTAGTPRAGYRRAARSEARSGRRRRSGRPPARRTGS